MAAVPALPADAYRQGGGWRDLVAGAQVRVLAEIAVAPGCERIACDGVLIVDDEGLEADLIAEVHVVIQSVLQRKGDGSGQRPAGGVQVEEQRLDVAVQAV